MGEFQDRLDGLKSELELLGETHNIDLEDTTEYPDDPPEEEEKEEATEEEHLCDACKKPFDSIAEKERHERKEHGDDEDYEIF